MISRTKKTETMVTSSSSKHSAFLFYRELRIDAQNITRFSEKQYKRVTRWYAERRFKKHTRRFTKNEETQRDSI